MLMEQDNLSFKKVSIGGFDRRQVLDYIYNLTASLNAEKEEISKQIESFGKLEKELKKEFANIKNENENLKKENEVLKSSYQSQVARGRELQDSILKAGEQCREAEAVIMRFRDDNDALRKQIEFLEQKSASLESKTAEIDELQLQARQTVMNARETATEIIEQAKREAQQIVARSQGYTRAVEANIELIKSDAGMARQEIADSLLRVQEALDRVTIFKTAESGSSETAPAEPAYAFYNPASMANASAKHASSKTGAEALHPNSSVFSDFAAAAKAKDNREKNEILAENSISSLQTNLNQINTSFADNDSEPDIPAFKAPAPSIISTNKEAFSDALDRFFHGARDCGIE